MEKRSLFRSYEQRFGSSDSLITDLLVALGSKSLLHSCAPVLLIFVYMSSLLNMLSIASTVIFLMRQVAK